MNKKLYRIKKGEQICGVCTGLAEFFNLDVTIVRVIWVLFVLLGGSGVLLYFVLALVIPEKPENIIDAPENDGEN